MSDANKESQQFSLFENEDPLAPITEAAAKTPPLGKYSNFVVYVDESGDHGMQTVDSNYSVFVLAFCVFHKRHYCEKVVPALQKFKFNHFGHDLVVLHEHEIRKEKGDFTFFQNRQHKHAFLTELTDIIEASNFILISCVIDKEQLRAKAGSIPNPYHLALGFCLETLYEFMQEKNQDGTLTHVVVECRGKKEDNELELEFRRICDGANRLGIPLPFDVIFADKKVNSAGLQLADLVARPVGLSVLRPAQENRAFEVLKRKFFCSGGREKVGEGFDSWGLKIYPTKESEKPR
ncbi:MAG: DUF3800 domain-containing protein [Gallionella sp.]|nr:DUF3800 domain-containing protein [Gallionella sp.]